MIICEKIIKGEELRYNRGASFDLDGMAVGSIYICICILLLYM